MYSEMIMKRTIYIRKSSWKGPYVLRNHHEKDNKYSEIIMKRPLSIQKSSWKGPHVIYLGVPSSLYQTGLVIWVPIQNMLRKYMHMFRWSSYRRRLALPPLPSRSCVCDAFNLLWWLHTTSLLASFNQKHRNHEVLRCRLCHPCFLGYRLRPFGEQGTDSNNVLSVNLDFPFCISH